MMLPIAFATLTLQFWVDKVRFLTTIQRSTSSAPCRTQQRLFVAVYAVKQCSILRLNRKPPKISNIMSVFMVHMLPFAIIIHLVVAVWVYGNNGVLPSPDVVFPSEIWSDKYHR